MPYAWVLLLMFRRCREKLAPLVLAAGLVALTSSPRASAQSSEADRATARSLAKEGHDALLKKDYALAEDRFRRADQLVHAPSLVVDHARALVGLGRLVEAHERYALVLREGLAPNAPPAFVRAKQDAEVEIEAIKPRLAWLTINVSGPNNIAVSLDSHDVPQAALGVRRAADPGERVVRVSAPGFLKREERLTLAEGEEKSIDIALELDPDASVTLPDEPNKNQPPKATESRPRDHTLTYVLWGVGGAGIALGAVTGVLFINKKSDLDGKCPNGKCPENLNLQPDIDRYHLYGILSPAGFGVGIAAAAAGTALLFVGDDEPSSSAAFVQPYVGPGSIGAYGRF
jgi:hypothetical protein